MKKIDQETVRRILDAADIVEVVSDFVNLKKRGANYIGLCPFHNERTPSFSVSRSKGICKCFSCGKGGSPVNFIMELEQMSFSDALRYLAKKYHIDIKEHEESEEERQRATERESMLAVNDFAMKHFEHNMTDTADGRDIGLAYFKERGINDLMIKKFRLGYALEKPDDFLRAALAQGFSEKYLIDTGLCSRSERGTVYDRFRGRVIYPVFSVSGRAIAFGGRTLRKDKSMAKYVNSPESIIYHKSNELYGLFQAKQSIVKSDKCILVEGYMDVISMHQVGIENVVASSGTSLTPGQIRLIHRFTKNVTVIYDSDAAGIKASLRGIDLLLAEGLDIKVLSLPDGEDPDSFAQSHSATEVEQYIKEHEIDFIRFKTNILLKDAKGDPIIKSRVISDIVRSISVIPDQVTRAVYIKECSRMLDIEERVLALQLDKAIGDNLQKRPYEQRSEAQAEQPTPVDVAATENPQNEQSQTPITFQKPIDSRIEQCEKSIMKYVVKYGLAPLAPVIDKESESQEADSLNVLDFVISELAVDELQITSPAYAKLMAKIQSIVDASWPTDWSNKQVQIEQERRNCIEQGEAKIRQEAKDMAEIEAMEKVMLDNVAEHISNVENDYKCKYLVDMLMSDEDDEIRSVSTELASERYMLSRVHTKYSHIETEQERLPELVPRAIMELKFAILEIEIQAMNDEIKRAGQNGETEKVNGMMTELFELYQIKSQFAKMLGDRIVNPKG